ncbi:thymidylate synthase, partial [Enterococcus faecalis]
EFVHTLGDAHLYQKHVEQMQEQLSREVRSFPTLVLNPDTVSVFDFDMEDIKVEGYDPHPTIKEPIAV